MLWRRSFDQLFLVGTLLVWVMIKAEIKDLYSEELALLKRIQNYGKGHRQRNPERVESVTLILLYRIYANLFSSLLLTEQALKREKISFYQLPLGIILRCCFTDCLFALFIQRVSKERAYEELDLRRIEYANSMLERKEVYKDQVKSSGDIVDDDFINDMWELSMEDNYLGLLTLADDNLKDLAVTKKSKDDLKKDGFSRFRSIETKKMTEYLSEIPEIKEVSTRLYHYFKYFSQYEHFSENGQGDVFASGEKDGNDNIHLPSAVRALSAGVEEIMKRMS